MSTYFNEPLPAPAPPLLLAEATELTELQTKVSDFYIRNYLRMTPQERVSLSTAVYSMSSVVALLDGRGHSQRRAPQQEVMA